MPAKPPATVADEGPDDVGGVLDDAMLQNTNQFYKWIAELEAARTSESEQKYEAYASILHGHLRASEDVAERVRWCLDWLCIGGG